VVARLPFTVWLCDVAGSNSRRGYPFSSICRNEKIEFKPPKAFRQLLLLAHLGRHDNDEPGHGLRETSLLVALICFPTGE
jgi:hypothetical protein